MTKRELINSPDYKVNQSVKIAGTNYDRRRKVTKSMKRRMIQMYESGKNLGYIAEYFSLSRDTVKRAVDEDFNEMEKERKNEVRRSKGYTSDYEYNRYKELAEYKRNLIKENKKLIISIPS